VSAYYPIVDIICWRCRAYSGAVDQALIDGNIRLSTDMVLETDGQEYKLRTC